MNCWRKSFLAVPAVAAVAAVAAVVAAIALIAASSLLVACGASETPAAESPASPTELLVAGASDLRPAFEKIGQLFMAETGSTVTFTFGSSGQLAQQIIDGAPFDVFASADVALVDDVVTAGRGDKSTLTTYAYGRLAIWSSPDIHKKLSLDDLSSGTISRIAIANPDHAPYGRAAVQALQSTGQFDSVGSKLVYGDNVSDAYRLGVSGNAEAAIVSLSLVIADDHGGQYSVVPAAAHDPLQQALVVTAKAPQADLANRFVAFVASSAGRETMRAYGFVLPGEPAPK